MSVTRDRALARMRRRGIATGRRQDASQRSCCWSVAQRIDCAQMRVSNFNAGPAGLPLPVLERARDELLDFQGSGMSIMEHTHRGKVYEAVHEEALTLFAELAGVPPTHQTLFMQGGAHAQFALVPMNFMQGRGADYVHTGAWSKGAMDEAKLFGTVRLG